VFFLDSQEFPDPLRRPGVHYGVHKIPPLDHIVSQFYTVSSPTYANVFVLDYILQVFYILAPGILHVPPTFSP